MVVRESIKNKPLSHFTKKLVKKKEWFWGYLFITPIVLGLLIFSVGPIIFSFYMSLTKWNSLTSPVFIGLKNYMDFFSDKRSLNEFGNTLYFAFGTVPVSIVLSILLANALNKKMIGTSFYRVLYFLPNVTMASAIALVWKWIFNSRLGLLNKLLGFFYLPQPAWLTDTKYIMIAVIIVSIWGGIGYNMIILLSGMQSIPQTLYEASEIDGASKLIKFTRITLPLLTPSIFFVLTVSLMGAFKSFDIIFVFAGGGKELQGPISEAIRTMVVGVYQNGFIFLKMGYASAQAVMLFVLIMIVTGLQFVLQKKWVFYE